MWANIVNPISGKKVSIYGKIGKKVISQYLKQIGGGKNPHTGKEWSSYTCKKLNEDKQIDIKLLNYIKNHDKIIHKARVFLDSDSYYLN